MAWAYRTSSYATDGSGFNSAPGSGGTFTSTVTLGAAVSAGDRIIVTIHGAQSSPGAAPTYSVRDSVNGAGAAYTQDVTLLYTDVNNIRVSVFSLANSAAGTPTITITVTAAVGGGSTGIFGGCQAAAYSGLLTSDPGLDVSGTNASSGSAATSGATATTTAANELVVGVYGDPGYGTTLTADGSYTQRGKHDSDGSNWQGLFEDKDSGTSGSTATATATSSDSGTHWGMLAAIYKLAAAGGAQDTPELYARPRDRRMRQILAQ